MIKSGVVALLLFFLSACQQEPGDDEVSRLSPPVAKKIAHDVRQTQPDKPGGEVPQADVHRLFRAAHDRGIKLDPHKDRPDHDDRIDPHRRLTPLDRLGLPQVQANIRR